MKKKIIIFGASTNGQWAKDLYELSNYYEIFAFADNDIKKQGTLFLGKQVLSAQDSVNTGYPIIIASVYASEISKQLDALGATYCLYEDIFVFYHTAFIITNVSEIEQLNDEYTKYYANNYGVEPYDNIYIDLNMDIPRILSRLNELNIDLNREFIIVNENNNFAALRRHLPNIKMLHDVFDMPFIPYLRLTLALNRRFELAGRINEVIKENGYYNYMGIYPLQINTKDKKVVCDVYDTETQNILDAVEIDSRFIASRKINAIFRTIKYDAKSKNVIIRGSVHSVNLPITNNDNITFNFYLKNKTKVIPLTTKKKDDNNFSNDIYKYNAGGFELYIDCEKFKKYDLFLQCSMYNQTFHIQNFIKLNAFKYKLDYIKYNLTAKYIEKNIEQAEQLKISEDRKRNLINAIKIYPYIYRDLPENIWLVGEKWGDSANDNGFAFFKRAAVDPDISAYYIIDKNSEDFPAVRAVGQCIEYFSFRHFLYSIHAKAVLSNGNPNALLPYENIAMFRQKTRVYLQHGVTYTKKQPTYDNALRDRYDYFVSTCDAESEILRRHYNVNDEQIIQTGLCRNDDMFDLSENNKIGIMFTWRPHINSVNDLLESVYFNSLKNLIIALAQKTNNTFIDVCVHPKMVEIFTKDEQGQEALNMLKVAPNVNIFGTSSTSITDMKKQSKILITDYSSLVFDFLYMNKPSINYIFDYSNEVALKENCLEESLPGYFAPTPEAVVKYVNDFFDGNLPVKNNKIKFDFVRDGKCSERTIAKLKQILNERV